MTGRWKRFYSYRDSWLYAYVFSFFSVIAVTIFKLQFVGVLDQVTPFFFYTVATALSAWFGGFGPGMFATALGGVSGLYIFDSSLRTLSPGSRAETVTLLLFFLQGFIVSLVAESLRRSRHRTVRLLRETRASAKKLKTAHARVQSILNNTVDGIITINQSGIIQTWNKGAEKMFGYSESETLGQNVKILMPEPYRSEHDSYLKKYLSTQIPKIINIGREVLGHKKSGELFPLFLSVSEIKSDSESIFIGVTRDLTAAKRTMRLEIEKEAALRANSAKRDFLANISHELRSPLGAIIGFSENLLDESPKMDSETREQIKVICRNAHHLLNLIDQLLDLSKIEAGRLDLNEVPIDVQMLLKDVKDLIKFRASEKGISFQSDCLKSIPPYIVGDDLRLRQILLNLLGNAIKFTKSGYVHMAGSSERAADGRVEITFIIEDTGVGISPDQQKQLFKPYSQADSKVASEFGGTGLGLVLARDLARKMGGDVRLLKSSPGKGSMFEAKVIVKECSEQEKLQLLRLNSHRKKTESQCLRGTSILIVDDSPDSRILMELFLKDSNARLTFAHDGQEAVSLAMTNAFDLIFMDIQMPRLTGLEAVRQLREMGVRTPLIALTAHAMPEERRKALESGFNDFITKPTTKHELIEKCLRWKQFENSQVDSLV